MVAPPKALALKRSAAAASRLAERRKSIVGPLEESMSKFSSQLEFLVHFCIALFKDVA